MPFSRKYAKRRRFRRGRRYNSRSFRKFSKRVKAVISKFAERRYHLTTSSTTNLNQTGAIFALSLISSGDTSTTRQGNHIKCLRFHMKYNIQNNDSLNGQVRIILMAVRGNIATPTLADVLKNTLDTYTAISVYNRDAYIKYKVLYDRLITQDYYKLSTTKKVNLRLKYHDIEWYSGTDSDWVSGQMFLLTVSDIAGPSGFDLKFVTSMTFIDV